MTPRPHVLGAHAQWSFHRHLGALAPDMSASQSALCKAYLNLEVDMLEQRAAEKERALQQEVGRKQPFIHSPSTG